MTSRPTDRAPVRILLSAAPRDRAFVQAFRAQLRSLELERLVSVTEAVAPPGEESTRWLDEVLERAEVFLPLVSAACTDGEQQGLLAEAKRRRTAGTLHVWPLVIRPCDWAGILGARIEPFNRGKPIGTPGNDKAWAESVNGLKELLGRLRPAVDELTPKSAAPASRLSGEEDSRARRAPSLGDAEERRAPNTDGAERFAALKLRVEEALKRSPPLVAALIDKGYLVVGQSEPARSVALALFGASAQRVAGDLAVLANETEVREAARAVFWLLLPIAGDWEDVLRQAQTAGDGDTLILRVATTTVAEIVIARTEERCCLFAPGNQIPQGANHVPLPSTSYAPLFDLEGRGLADSVLMNLWRPQENPPPGEEVWRAIRREVDNDGQFAAAAAARINRDALLGTRRYLLFIDAKLDALTKDLDSSWTRARDALRARLPGLRLVRLQGRQPEFDDEIQLYPFVQHVRDLP